MKFFMVALVASLSVAFAAAQQPATSAPRSTMLMPAGRAQATIEDSRFQAFIKAVRNDMGGACVVPQFDKVEAKVLSNGRGDFSSTFYEFDLECSPGRAVAGVSVTVEFSPPNGLPLNLDLCVHFKR